MNSADRRKMSEMPQLDEIVNRRFRGAKCTTTFSIFSMRHATTWNNKLPVRTKRRIKLFVEGFMAGNQELRDRMAPTGRNG